MKTIVNLLARPNQWLAAALLTLLLFTLPAITLAAPTDEADINSTQTAVEQIGRAHV